jgi:hypothetical protein
MSLQTIADDNGRHRGKNWFLWGIGLAVTSSLPFVVPILTLLRGISSTKATGLAAVAGGVTELYVTSGLILTFMLPIAAIVFLTLSFSGGNQARKLFSLLAIGWSVFVLFLYGAAAWFFFVQQNMFIVGPR